MTGTTPGGPLGRFSTTKCTFLPTFFLLCFFFLFFFASVDPPVPRAPAVSGFLCFPAPGDPGLGALRFLLPAPPCPLPYSFSFLFPSCDLRPCCLWRSLVSCLPCPRHSRCAVSFSSPLFFFLFFLLSPAHCACVVPFAAWYCRAAPTFCLLFSVAVLWCSVLHGVPWCPALCCCAAHGVVFFGLPTPVLCCAVPCCSLLLPVVSRLSPWCPAVLFVLWPAVLPSSVSRCAVLCSWLVCYAALRRVVPRSAVLLCAGLLCIVPFGAAARCVVPSGNVLRPGVFCLLVLCFVVFFCAASCCWLLCFVLYVSLDVVVCVPCPLRSARCCAALCWCACVALFV